jgi:hypothetical protein
MLSHMRRRIHVKSHFHVYIYVKSYEEEDTCKVI